MQIDARLTYNKVRFDQEAEAHLVVSLTAPGGKVEDRRPPLCIVPLLDLSSSMDGDKLAYAKKSLIKLIDHLSPNDYCGLVTFSYQARLVQKPVRCTAEAKDELKRKVGGLKASGATNIGDALLEGFKVANDMDLANEVLTRVILFTDGAANTGPAKTPGDILALVGPNIGIASVSAFGYGPDAEQDFLRSLSQSGRGNYSFVANPDDALSAFGKELGGLLSTYGTNLVLELSPLAGHQIAQVISDVEAEEEALGQVVIKIPDILAEETRHLVVAVKLQEQKNAFPREVNVFDVKLGYDTLDANLRRERNSLEAKAKIQFVKEGEEQKAADPELDRIVGLAQIVRAQIEAEEHAKKGEYNEASAVMDNISKSIGSRGYADLGVVAHNMSNRFATRAAYTGSSSYLASFARGATRGMGGTYDVSAARDLRTVGVASFDNSVQASVAASFTDDQPEADAPPMPRLVQDFQDYLDSVGNGVDNSGFTIGDPVGNHGITIGGPVTIGDPAGTVGWGTSQNTSVTAPQTPPVVHAIMTPFVIRPEPAVAPEKPKGKAKARKRKITQKSNRW